MMDIVNLTPLTKFLKLISSGILFFVLDVIKKIQQNTFQ